jgi:putative nucleotidyltransferase with HDIG domain
MSTVIISTNEVVPGMVVAQDIYTFSNQLLIGARTPLTDRIITRLKFYAIGEIEILDDEEAATVNGNEEYLQHKDKPILFPESVDISPTHLEDVAATEEFKNFSKSYEDFSEEFKTSLDDVISKGKDVNTTKLLMQVNSVLSEGRTSIHLLDMLQCMRDHSDHTYTHSINVAIICNIIAKWLNFSEKESATLTLCGLLHDIGKLEIDPEILNKPSLLTDEEYQIVKTHTTKGYQILKDKAVDNHIKYSALMHHERCDGTGYPNQYLGRSIDDYAKIVAIADTYDAMTCARPYRGPLCPFEVIEFFEFEGLQKFDPQYLLIFLNGVVQTYQGNTVLLSNGQKGKILMLNKNYLSRPVISVGSTFVDLAAHRDIMIKQVI